MLHSPHLANETATADAATTSAAGKKDKSGKASKADKSNASNSTVSAASNSTSTHTGKKSKVRLIEQEKMDFYVDISQGTGAGKKSSSAAAGSSSSDIVSTLETELSSLGINLGSLGLRSLPVLEARKGKKKNGTEVASGAAVSRRHPLLLVS